MIAYLPLGITTLGKSSMTGLTFGTASAEDRTETRAQLEQIACLFLRSHHHFDPCGLSLFQGIKS